VTSSLTKPGVGPGAGRSSGDGSRPAGPPRRAYVVVLAGDRMGEMVELDATYTTIGRGLTATVRIND
jgi:hypothetical protein